MGLLRLTGRGVVVSSFHTNGPASCPELPRLTRDKCVSEVFAGLLLPWDLQTPPPPAASKLMVASPCLSSAVRLPQIVNCTPLDGNINGEIDDVFANDNFALSKMRMTQMRMTQMMMIQMMITQMRMTQMMMTQMMMTQMKRTQMMMTQMRMTQMMMTQMMMTQMLMTYSR